MSSHAEEASVTPAEAPDTATGAAAAADVGGVDVSADTDGVDFCVVLLLS